MGMTAMTYSLSDTMYGISYHFIYTHLNTILILEVHIIILLAIWLDCYNGQIINYIYDDVSQ